MGKMELRAEIKRLQAENERLQAEATPMRQTLHDIYPMIAGQVIALEKAGETVAHKQWGEVARRVYKAERSTTAGASLLDRMKKYEAVVDKIDRIYRNGIGSDRPIIQQSGTTCGTP